MTDRSWRFAELTWPQVRDLVDDDPVLIVPTATIEDHGHHLPIDTDERLVTAVSEGAVQRAFPDAYYVPPVIHGFTPHHMDFPGTISIAAETFVHYVRDVCLSLARHGFRRILVVNGHGSNTALVETATRLVSVEMEGAVLCGSVNYWASRKVRESVAALRDSPVPGGVNHAGEFETALYLALEPELVDMDQAVDDRNRHESDHFWYDLAGSGDRVGGPVALMEWWSAVSPSGVMGSANLATRAKGDAWLEASIAGLVDIIGELKERPIPARVDHHRRSGR